MSAEVHAKATIPKASGGLGPLVPFIYLLEGSPFNKVSVQGAPAKIGPRHSAVKRGIRAPWAPSGSATDYDPCSVNLQVIQTFRDIEIILQYFKQRKLPKNPKEKALIKKCDRKDEVKSDKMGMSRW